MRKLQVILVVITISLFGLLLWPYLKQYVYPEKEYPPIPPPSKNYPACQVTDGSTNCASCSGLYKQGIRQQLNDLKGNPRYYCCAPGDDPHSDLDASGNPTNGVHCQKP